MKSNNLIPLGPWIFVIAIWTGLIWTGQGIEFFGIIILFVLALIGSIVLASLSHGKECCEGLEVDRGNELQSMHSKLDTLLKDVENIKRVIEE